MAGGPHRSPPPSAAASCAASQRARCQRPGALCGGAGARAGSGAGQGERGAKMRSRRTWAHEHTSRGSPGGQECWPPRPVWRSSVQPLRRHWHPERGAHGWTPGRPVLRAGRARQASVHGMHGRAPQALTWGRWAGRLAPLARGKIGSSVRHGPRGGPARVPAGSPDPLSRSPARPQHSRRGRSARQPRRTNRRSNRGAQQHCDPLARGRRRGGGGPGHAAGRWRIVALWYKWGGAHCWNFGGRDRREGPLGARCLASGGTETGTRGEGWRGGARCRASGRGVCGLWQCAGGCGAGRPNTTRQPAGAAGRALLTEQRAGLANVHGGI